MWDNDSEPFDDRDTNPRWAQMAYPGYTAPQVPDTIPQWMLDQPTKED